MLDIKKQQKALESFQKKGGISPDERIDLIEEMTALQDQLGAFIEALAEIPDLLEDEEGVATATIPANSPMIIKKYRKA